MSPSGNLSIRIFGSEINITNPAKEPKLKVSTIDTTNAPKKITINKNFSRFEIKLIKLFTLILSFIIKKTRVPINVT